MNRLTKKYKNGIITLDADKFPNVGQETLDREIGAFAPFRRAVEALCEYEDAEENGTLVRLPCKVGDTIYYISPMTVPKEIEKYTVTGILFDKENCQIRTYNSKGVIIYFYLDFIGRTVFLTREEAEAALKAWVEDV